MGSSNCRPSCEYNHTAIGLNELWAYSASYGCRDNRPRERLRKINKVAKDCNFFPFVLQVYSTKVLEEIHKRTSCTKILKKKPTVDSPDSTTIRLNFVDEPGAIPCILRGAPQQIHIHTLTFSFYL